MYCMYPALPRKRRPCWFGFAVGCIEMSRRTMLCWFPPPSTWGKEVGPGEATEGRKLGPRTAVPTTAAVAPPTIAAFTKDRREVGLGFSSMAQLTTRPARHNPCVSKRTQPVGASQEQATGHGLQPGHLPDLAGPSGHHGPVPALGAFQEDPHLVPHLRGSGTGDGDRQ